MNHQIAEIPNSRVFDSLDGALLFAEDVIIAKVSPQALKEDSGESFQFGDPSLAIQITRKVSCKSFALTLSQKKLMSSFLRLSTRHTMQERSCGSRGSKYKYEGDCKRRGIVVRGRSGGKQ